jgi:hypothetical protein
MQDIWQCLFSEDDAKNRKNKIHVSYTKVCKMQIHTLLFEVANKTLHFLYKLYIKLFKILIAYVGMKAISYMRKK